MILIEINENKQKHEQLTTELVDINKKQELLADIPCGDSFPTCKFIRDAHVTVASKELVEYELNTALTDLHALNPDNVVGQIVQYSNINKLIKAVETEITQAQLERERNKTLKSKIELTLKDISLKIDEYEENKEAIENLEKLLREKRSLQKSSENKQKKITSCEEETLNLVTCGILRTTC